MSDNDQPKRPNANYKLSKQDGVKGDEEIVFYYNRERRLQKAPQAVRDLYDNSKKPSRFGLLNVLVADKPRALVFFTILIMAAVILVLSLLNYIDGSYTLEGNKIEISGIRYEGVTVIALRKTRQNADAAYTGVIDIAVSPAAHEGEEYPVFYHRVFFSLEDEEAYRFTAPFDSPELLIVLQTDKTTLKITYRPE